MSEVERATCTHGKPGPHGIDVPGPMDSFSLYYCPGPDPADEEAALEASAEGAYVVLDDD